MSVPQRELRGSGAAAPFRLTIRTALGGLIAVLGAFAVSCQGSNCSTVTQPAPLTLDLAAVYHLSTVNGLTLPTRYADSAGFQLRVLSDTLRLSLTDSSYGEAGRVSRLNPSSHEEVVYDYVLRGSHRFSRMTASQYSFPAFLGGSATATAQASYGHALLTLTTPDGQKWAFTPGV